jgi:S-adenosylmethionine:tRNA ribosyltransferase-isomerase
MRTIDLDFDLPPELIAQSPAKDREDSRLLAYRRAERSIGHHRFAALTSLLRPGDLLVFNDAKVLPARFMLRKPTGGRVEGLFLKELERGRWQVLLRNAGGASGLVLGFEQSPGVTARVTGIGAGGEHEISLNSNEAANVILGKIGRMPLPPYIKREKGSDPRDEEDRERYQTIYAKNEGSVAAPTAGLHFTEQILSALGAAGIEQTTVTLDVGLGTFKPITADTLEGHQMHVESYSISPKSADALNAAKRDGRRIIAVGTTSARVLESQPAEVPFTAKQAETGILIKPPYAWRHVQALITNFHLPRSTLIALVAAMVGLEEQRRIYQTAIDQRYRFFSYGDAMFID